MVGEIRSTIKDLEEAIKEVSKFGTEEDDRSPLEAARDSQWIKYGYRSILGFQSWNQLWPFEVISLKDLRSFYGSLSDQM